MSNPDPDVTHDCSWKTYSSQIGIGMLVAIFTSRMPSPSQGVHGKAVDMSNGELLHRMRAMAGGPGGNFHGERACLT